MLLQPECITGGAIYSQQHSQLLIGSIVNSAQGPQLPVSVSLVSLINRVNQWVGPHSQWLGFSLIRVIRGLVKPDTSARPEVNAGDLPGRRSSPGTALPASAGRVGGLYAQLAARRGRKGGGLGFQGEEMLTEVVLSPRGLRRMADTCASAP